MVYKRDPLSERWDDYTYPLILRAIRASRRGHAVTVWITSPSAEFRQLDSGGLTPHERGFVRSCYYLVGPGRRAGAPYTDWSLRRPVVIAGPVPSMAGQRARQIRLRIFARSAAKPKTASWMANPELRSGAVGSEPQRFTA